MGDRHFEMRTFSPLHPYLVHLLRFLCPCHARCCCAIYKITKDIDGHIRRRSTLHFGYVCYLPHRIYPSFTVAPEECQPSQSPTMRVCLPSTMLATLVPISNHLSTLPGQCWRTETERFQGHFGSSLRTKLGYTMLYGCLGRGTHPI